MLRKISIYILSGLFVFTGAYLAIYFLMSPVPPKVSMVDTDEGNWMPGEDVEVRISGHDTIRAYDMRIVLRYDERYRLDSLPLLITVISPDSLTFTENTVIATGLPAGRLRNTAEISAPYRSHNTLARTGTYTFTFSHTLQEAVAGITAIGVMLE